MEEAFNKLEQDRRNSLDNIIQWMKDSKIIDGVKVTEDKARKLFEDVPDSKNIEIGKFKEALTTLASEQHRTIEEFTNILAKTGPKFVSGILAVARVAAGTLKECFVGKSGDEEDKTSTKSESSDSS